MMDWNREDVRRSAFSVQRKKIQNSKFAVGRSELFFLGPESRNAESRTIISLILIILCIFGLFSFVSGR